MKIVFLIIDYVPHQISTIRNLITEYNVQIRAYHVGMFCKSVPEIEGLFESFQYEENQKEQVYEQIVEFRPDMVVGAGWMVKDYMWILKKIKKRFEIPVVGCSDTPWYGSYRQFLNTVISRWYVRKSYSHMWVAGIQQYEYARRLGFRNQEIVFDCLSANSKLFSTFRVKDKRESKRFLFVGRFVNEKGISFLLDAWSSIKDTKEWSLVLVGDGPLKKNINIPEGVFVKEFMDQDRLLIEMHNSDVFILPSIHEPWGVVIHEAVSAGLPVICTETCGAADHFIINNYNGYKVAARSSEKLTEAMEQFLNMSEETLSLFSERSFNLSKKISNETSIANLMQLLKL